MYWRSPVLRVRVGGGLMDPPPLNLRVEQRLGHNTLMYVSTMYPMDSQTLVRPQVIEENTLIRVDWGTAPSEVVSWYGYNNHADYQTNSPRGQKHVQVDYVLVGTGHGMVGERSHGWRKITDSGIAKELADRYGLSLVAHRTKYIHDYVLQDAKSDLAFLQERAALSGRRAWVENGTLYFVDPASWSAARKDSTLNYTVNKDGNETYDAADFRAYVGGDMPDPTGRLLDAAAMGVDRKSGKVIYDKSWLGDAPRPVLLTDTRLDSVSEMDRTLAAKQATSQDWLKAEAVLVGSTKLQPGQPIKIGGKGVAERLKGDWVITAATHFLKAPVNTSLLKNQAEFTTHVELARNAPDRYVYRDRKSPKVADGCTALNGLWVAARRQVVLL